MEKLFALLFALAGTIAFVLFVCAIFALPVMLLWNYCLVGAVDGIHEIGFWQALGLLILTSLMFKNNTKKDEK